MKAPASRSATRRLIALLASCALTLSLAVANVQADSYDERRVRMAARLVRAMLTADPTLAERRDADGRLHVVLYAIDPQLSQDLTPLIVPPNKASIRGMPIAIDVASKLPNGDSRPAGVFLASRPSDAELDQLIAWSIRNKVIVYSPFEGHVERGVAGGISLEAKLQPYVNRKTLEASGVELKPLFMKAAKVYP